MRNFLFTLLALVSFWAEAQFGQFQALSLPSGARTAALGGYQVSLADGDVVQFIQNPAVLDSVSSGAISLNYQPYLADVNAFSGAYAADFSKVGKLAIGLTYLSYGSFVERDASGNELGTFQGGDFVLAIGKSHTAGSFSFGVNLKLLQSGISGYNATAMAFDLGGIYRSAANPFTVGLVFKNFGVVLSDYTATQTQLPFDVQIGISTKPEHMPFRFTVTAYNLIESDLLLPADSEASQAKAIKLFDEAFSRITIGTELILGKNVNLLFGYNHLRRNELRLESTAGGAGLSYGLMIGIKKFTIRYTHATYNPAGGANFFAVETNLRTFSSIL